MRNHLLTLLIISALTNLSSQTPPSRVLFKVDARAIFLQPKISLEFLFNQSISFEVGAGLGWTSEAVYHDQLGDRFGYTLYGFGPSKSQDLFSDFKILFSNGWYFGLGYMYRYSHFENKKFAAELSQDNYQLYTQTEAAYINTARITVGKFIPFGNNKFGVNPYLAVMIGKANVSFSIDTIPATSYKINYSPVVFPNSGKTNFTFPMIEFGCKFYFGVLNRKDD